ncbi:hypothetical protein CANMA_005111 [Candida margitis]|uniref:uncharacterized protein n=1 Tax=Candida margitis TaxID=1775924 RepID=UPI002225E678|nr:uncharacterized protein CANMA_005111 [Candida margitis]KAI5952124.1 hypothetical protein CANMA_005111 [Candida margitis]
MAYTKLKNIAPDERILQKKQKLDSSISEHKQQQQQQSQQSPPNDSIDISQDAPILSTLIQYQRNSEELTQELKNLLIKYYWAGFELHDKLHEAEPVAASEVDKAVDNENNEGEKS